MSSDMQKDGKYCCLHNKKNWTNGKALTFIGLIRKLMLQDKLSPRNRKTGEARESHLRCVHLEKLLEPYTGRDT